MPPIAEDGRPRAAGLEFRLFDRPLHPELFRVRVERRIQAGPWDIGLRLLSGGHTVEVHHPLGWITEVVDTVAPAEDPDVPAEPFGLVRRLTIRGERSWQTHWKNGVQYRLSLQAEQLSPPLFAHVEAELRRCGRGPLSTEFESTMPDRPGAFSYLDCELLAGRRVSILGFHTFPEELTIVRTQSLLELPE